MSRSLIKNDQDINILFPVIEQSLTIDQIERLVSIFPDNSYGRLYNKVFDENSFVFILNGQWKFFHSLREEIQTWDWNKDVAEMSEDSSDEFELLDFNNGWKYVDDQEFPILDLNYSIPVEYVSLQRILELCKFTISDNKESYILSIIQDQTISDIEKTKKILNII